MIKEQTWDKKNHPIKMEILECLLYPIFYPHTHFLCLISSCGCSSLDICIFLKTHFVEGDTPGNVWSVHYEINLVFLQDKIGLPWEIKKEMTRRRGELILFQWLEWNSFHGIWLCNPLKCKHKSALEIRRRKKVLESITFAWNEAWQFPKTTMTCLIPSEWNRQQTADDYGQSRKTTNCFMCTGNRHK